jgi:hypothetical protein
VNEIIVVSGVPRSGTSVMMQMLDRGGLAVLSDGIRTADEDNPRGYYELERIKRLPHDASCLDDAPGNAVKIISELLPYLPDRFTYRIIFMRRNIDEVLASQAVMLERRQQAETASDPRMRSLLIRHINDSIDLLRDRPNARVMYASYNRLVVDPATVARAVAAFLEQPLDIDAMVAAVRPELHRHRPG